MKGEIDMITRVFSEQKLAHIDQAIGGVMKLNNKIEHIENTIHNFAPI